MANKAQSTDHTDKLVSDKDGVPTHTSSMKKPSDKDGALTVTSSVDKPVAHVDDQADQHTQDKIQVQRTQRGRAVKTTEKGKEYQLGMKRDVFKKQLRMLKRRTALIAPEDGDEGVISVDADISDLKEWIRCYVEFMQTCKDLETLSPEVLSSVKEEIEKFENIKSKIQEQFAKEEAEGKAHIEISHQRPMSNRSAGMSVRSQIELKRLEDAQKRAEIEAKAAAMRKKQELERKQQELERKMQQLEVENELAILEAKEEALNKFEEEEGALEPPASSVRYQMRSYNNQEMYAAEPSVLKNRSDHQELLHQHDQTLPMHRARDLEQERQVDAPRAMQSRGDENEEAFQHDQTQPHVNIEPQADRHATVPRTVLRSRPEREEIPHQHSQTLPTDISDLVSVLKEQNNQSRLPVIEPEIFSGSIERFPIWMKAFETYVEHRTPCPVERLHFLSRYTEGEAHSAIAGFLHLRTHDAYSKAKEKLTARYGNDYILANTYTRRLREWPAVRAGDSKGLQRLADFLEHCLMASTAIAGMRALDDPHTIQLVLRKLPVYITDRWKRLVDANVYGPAPRYPSFPEFVQLVTTEARIACGPVTAQLDDESTLAKGPKNTKSRAHTFVSSTEKTACESCGHQSQETSGSAVTSGRTRRPCVVCGADHTVSVCEKFSSMNLQDRKAEVDKKGLCRGCLKPGHRWRDCRRRAKCDKCSRAHPTLLHDEAFMKRSTSAHNTSQAGNDEATRAETHVKASSLQSTVQTGEDGNTPHCHTMIVPVEVYRSDRPEHRVVAYALLDSQSDASFITDTLCDTLNPENSEVELELSTMNGNRKLKCLSVSGLVIESLENGSAVDLPTLYTRQEIPADRELIPRRETCLKWTHLHEVADKIPEYQAEAGIGLLLGVNCPRIIKPREVIPGEEDDPWAVRTLFGWGIVGLISKDAPKSCFYVGTGQDRKKLCHFAYRTRAKEASLRQVHEVFDGGFFENRQNKAISQDDVRFISTMSEGMHQVENGHFEAPLPLKDEENLPNNRYLAEARLSQLKKKLSRDDKLREDYTNFMNELLSKGYAEAVPPDEETRHGMTNYVPHHGVYHQKKGKLRVVFDCSALYKDDCLNSRLLQGPDVNNNLTGILIRFREGPVAFSGDIEGMFNQVRVNPEHRSLLRFLWWNDGDLDSEPQEYRMCTHLFGATSSPAVALFALKKTAEAYGEDVSPDAASFVERNFYIDDGVTSTRTPEDALQLIQDSVSLCSKGGFKLHKFVSNSKDVLKALPIYSLSQSCQAAVKEGSQLPHERVLGVDWDVETDSLCVDVSLPRKPATRRGILSSLSTIYDPLGFISPCTLVAKNILKRLCIDKSGWDDPISEDMQREWSHWKEDVEQLSTLKIPRCYVTPEFGEVEKFEVHHFSDASFDGCGQCSYLRAVYKDGNVTSTLIMSKARVTPVRAVTIPRLELVGALMSVKVSCFLRDEMSIGNYDEYFWTDSRAVLGYVYNETKRFHVFVANRVQEIRQHTEPHQWRYIESGKNPADLASRGASASELLNSSLWWRGPELLTVPCHKSDSETPQSHIPDPEQMRKISDEDPEVKRHSFNTAATKKEDYPSLSKRLEYFSSWFRARKAVAQCLRYKLVLTGKGRHMTGESPYVSQRKMTVDELHDAERDILKSVQKEAFEEEYNLLKTLQDKEGCDEKEKGKGRRRNKDGKNKFLKRRSPLYKLDPFLREDGLICVGGRMKNSSLPREIAHPVILPRKSHVTSLIVKECHERVCHAGRNSTLNELRAAGYWVVGGRSAVGAHILSCIMCRKLRGRPQEQKMADLPRERTEQAEPFSYCAVDCFGPFYVKERRSEVKRWGILFNCMASRAIHLESVNTLSADSFLNAFRRFVARRGPVRKLFCDRGTNFVGGKNMLQEALKEEELVRIRGELLKRDCDICEFKFNVPMASSMGGVWERMIRSVRSALTPLIATHGHTMDDELFRTLLAECEAIVNSRPLTYLGGTSDDTILPLSPLQLLTLKDRVAVPFPGSFSRSDLYVRQRWRRVQFLADQFWRRWRRDFLPGLQERQKWVHRRPDLQPGDVVIVVDDDEPRSRWPLGRLVNVYPSADGLVRKVCVRIGSTTYDRPVSRVILLMRDQGDSQTGSDNDRAPDGEPRGLEQRDDCT